MSDTSSNILDPKRPWLTDERELPSNMNWLQTLFNPAGESPRLHFTRAWTMLFMMQLLIILVPFAIAAVINMAGGNGKPVGAFGLYATPVVFIVTTLMSYVIHSRRLRDAGKLPVLAIVPLIPLVLAGLALFATTEAESAKYDKRFDMRQEFLADPDAFRAKQNEQQKKAREEAEQRAAEAEAKGEEPKPQQGPRGRPGPGGPGGTMGLEKPLPPKAQTVLKASLPTFQNVIILLSGFVAIWSLLWVARVPFFGTYPGDPESRASSRTYEN